MTDFEHVDQDDDEMTDLDEVTELFHALVRATEPLFKHATPAQATQIQEVIDAMAHFHLRQLNIADVMEGFAGLQEKGFVEYRLEDDGSIQYRLTEKFLDTFMPYQTEWKRP